MKFSVVITTYNRLKLLQRAVKSVLKQTIPCELVIVDDCSSDGTQDYVGNLNAQLRSQENALRLVYHRNLVNSGHAATVNAGVQASNGDWIKFLDDDDYLASNCLEEMTKAIAMRERAVICSCVAAQVNTDEAELSRTPIVGPGLTYYIPQADIHYGMLLELVPFGTPVQVACRRDVFLKTGGWNSKLDTNCDDIDSWIRISQFGDAIFLNQCLAYRTIWSGAYNHKFSLQQRLDTNIFMKEQIYALVNEKHQTHTPAFQDIKNYLKLHWFLIALKSGNIKSCWQLLDSSLLSVNGWKILLSSFLTRQLHHHHPHIQKCVLIE
ncbi:MAG: glycosyltransferase family 2 protein [Scytonema sp. PMC 1069.18]|nr:glycosyltransferase family 2 protein [Scytonema sp. PMC 1069.18]MEC4882688.1 glycosyltransferase family 2 protein [Scytonema sp. PMC 1070.18]